MDSVERHEWDSPVKAIGRPREIKDPCRVNVTFESGEYDTLYAEAKARGLTVPAWIRRKLATFRAS